MLRVCAVVVWGARFSAWRSRRWSTESTCLTSRPFGPLCFSLIQWVSRGLFREWGEILRIFSLGDAVGEAVFRFRMWWECGFLEKEVCVFDVVVGWIVQADADVLRQVRGKKVSSYDVVKLMCNSSLL